MFNLSECPAKRDPELWQWIDAEAKRQEQNIELIASENYASPAVMAAQGSCLTNKYAEGYPGKRYYGGCEFVDEVERLAIERAKKLFCEPAGVEMAVNVQPHSGARTVDIECGSTTNSLKRQREAAFSVSYFGIQVSAAVWKSSGIKSLEDLNGKTVTVTSGTTSVALIKEFEKAHNLKIRYLMTKDFAESMQLVANKRADAFILDDVLLAGQISNLPNASEFTILDASLGVEPYGAMFRKDDAPFKAVVDKTVKGMIASGELAKLYSTWFESPIPPKNINLNFKMNSYTKELFANPSDKGI